MGPISGYLTPVAMLRRTAKMCHSKVELKTLVANFVCCYPIAWGWGSPNQKKVVVFSHIVLGKQKQLTDCVKPPTKMEVCKDEGSILFLEGFGSEGLGLPDVGIIFVECLSWTDSFKKADFFLYWGGGAKRSMSIWAMKKGPLVVQRYVGHENYPGMWGI